MLQDSRVSRNECENGHLLLCAVGGQDKFFDSPSAFSIHLKRLINPARKADDGWKTVKFDNRWDTNHYQFSPKELQAPYVLSLLIICASCVPLLTTSCWHWAAVMWALLEDTWSNNASSAGLLCGCCCSLFSEADNPFRL